MTVLTMQLCDESQTIRAGAGVGTRCTGAYHQNRTIVVHCTNPAHDLADAPRAMPVEVTRTHTVTIP